MKTKKIIMKKMFLLSVVFMVLALGSTMSCNAMEDYRKPTNNHTSLTDNKLLMDDSKVPNVPTDGNEDLNQYLNRPLNRALRPLAITPPKTIKPYKKQYSGIIVVLNGPSGSGKTTLAKAFLNKIKELSETRYSRNLFYPEDQTSSPADCLLNPWKIVAVDDLEDDEIDQCKETKSLSAEGQAVIKKIKKLMKANPTSNIIVDTVLKNHDFDDVNGFIEAFEHESNQLYMILIYCDPAKLVHRSLSRQDSQERTARTPLQQLSVLFRHTPTPRPTASASTLSFSASPEIPKQQPTQPHLMLSGSPPILARTVPPQAKAIPTITIAQCPKDDITSSIDSAYETKNPREIRISERGKDLTREAFYKGISAKDIDASNFFDVSPNVYADLTIINNTEADCQKAVDNIIQLIIDRQTQITANNNSHQ